jgi:hypothetical protein
MRLNATYNHNGSKQYLNFPFIGSTTNWHQPGVCLSIVFPYTLFGGGGYWGLVIPTYTPHPGTLSLVWGGGGGVRLCGTLLGSSP